MTHGPALHPARAGTAAAPRLARADSAAQLAHLVLGNRPRAAVLILVLIAIGLVAVAAASPAARAAYSTAGQRLDDLYFCRQLHVAGRCSALPVMLVVSMLPRQAARRLARSCWALVMLAALMLVPFIGVEVNGAKRWLDLAACSFQPSEFLKPAFVVALAWLLSLRAHDPNAAGGADRTGC